MKMKKRVVVIRKLWFLRGLLVAASAVNVNMGGGRISEEMNSK